MFSGLRLPCGVCNTVAGAAVFDGERQSVAALDEPKQRAQFLQIAILLLVHCYPSNGCVVVHAAKFWRKSSGDNTLTATASFAGFGSSGYLATLLPLLLPALLLFLFADSTQ